MKQIALALLLCTFVGATFAQPINLNASKKQLQALRSEKSIVIDGILNEEAWNDAIPASNFVQHLPVFGGAPAQPTDVKVLYNDAGLYISAILHDSKPDSILQELTQRDNLGNTDWFGIFIDAYRDGINGVFFIVTPANVQLDGKISALSNNNNGNTIITRGEDISWDAVWESKTQLTPSGWIVEMKIPYAALRFPKAEEQTWHVNFARGIRRYQQRNYWNAVDPQQDGFFNQAGYLAGIKNIKAPIRLQATPFVAIYGEQYHDKNSSPKNSYGRSFNGGMDIKYGINDAFTLDMTLIPDFGEAQSDNQVLNLSPFEVQFAENRQFFTEGTELFNKGGLFYSRRVGGTPLRYWDVEGQLQEGEEIVENPVQGQLYNATKISGRTAKGLGIGLFNATSGRTFATIRNAAGEERKIETDPLTNFNVFVLDQNLKNNSFLSLVNTTVLRSGADYDANVTGTVFTLRDKANAYSLSGKAVLSQKYFAADTELGHTFNLVFRKTSGKLVGGAGYNEESNTYDINDLGFLFNNNSRNAFAYIEYNLFKPFWKFNRGGLGVEQNYSWLYKPTVFQNYSINFWSWAETKSFWNFNLWTYHEPFINYDFFEPRTPGRYYRFPTNNNVGFWMGTDSRKRIRLSGNTNFRTFGEKGRYNYNWNISPRFRASDKLSFAFTFGRFLNAKDVGFVNNINHPETGEAQIIFGVRDRETFENVFNTSYNFNQNMALTFRMRHYWSKVKYERFQLLQNDGTLSITDYQRNHDTNFDAFNIDMIFRWRFAPGSDLFFIWKNAVFDFDEYANLDYFEDLETLFQSPQSNSLSLKIIYFIDYNNVVSARRK